VTPLRTRIAAAIESSGFRITIFDNRTRGTNRGQARREYRLALGSVGCDGIVPRVMGSGHFWISYSPTKLDPSNRFKGRICSLCLYRSLSRLRLSPFSSDRGATGWIKAPLSIVSASLELGPPARRNSSFTG
jgi:hypothetical protein